MNNNEKLSEKQIEDLVEVGVNAACLAIQNAIGQDDGGLASMFFTGNDRDAFEDILRRYIQTENVYRGEEE